jgi:excisionase family DNA binding protein
MAKPSARGWGLTRAGMDCTMCSACDDACVTHAIRRKYKQMAHPKTEKSEWITKEEAAKILGVNVRQVQKRAEQGYIEKRLLARLPNERQARVVYARHDVDAIVAGTPNHCQQVEEEPKADGKKIDTGLQKAFAQYTRAGLPPMTAEGAFAFPLLPEAQLARVIAETNKLRAETVRIQNAPRKEWPLLLTFDQGVEYLNAPAAMLEKLIRDGSIPALWGRGRGTWRISRASLDEYGQAGA